MDIQEKPISIIVAIAQNYAIGKDNKLLWHISEDLKRFKKITAGHTVIMGKNTYYSLPVRPLPNRRNIVITDIQGEKIEGCQMAYSIEDAINKADSENENFIIGGASIYRQFFTIVQKLYITYVYSNFEADTYFPKIEDKDWELIENAQQQEIHKDGLKYDFRVYKRN
jgi:dihydrofolate reductase